MKALIGGVGRIAMEVIKRLSESWEVTLVDMDAEIMERAISLGHCTVRVIQGDASSPVVLDKAGVADQDYVLALTRDDQVNLALASHAVKREAGHVCALVYDADLKKRYVDMGAHPIMASTLIAQHLFHYLQDPRMRTTPLALGPGTVMEVRASEHFRVVGKRAAYFNTPTSRLAMIFRGEELIFPTPRTTIQTEDRLVLLGQPDLFEPVCDLLECGNPHFPLAYGPGLLVALAPADKHPRTPTLTEGLYISQNTQIKRVTVICPEEVCNLDDHLRDWPQDVQVESLNAKNGLLDHVRARSRDGDYGLVVLPPVETSFISSLVKATHVSLSSELDCPVLVSRHTMPFQRLLAPFTASPCDERALEIAVDISRQLGSSITAVIVEEPEFLKGEDARGKADAMANRLKELAHVHKLNVDTIVRKGNPVREIVELSKDFDLLLVGSDNTDQSFFTPNVAELLARKAHCSVLLTAS